MTYVIPAYVIVVGGILAYAVLLARERRRLEQRLSLGDGSNPG